MSAVAAFLQIGRNQRRNVFNALRGHPLAPTSFASMTLDQDDIEIAERLLAERSRWDDHDVVIDYQRRFAEWNGTRHAFAFMSGREALSACLEALQLVPGDEVIVPAYTCVVVVNALRYAGINPVFVDIELDTYGADHADVARKITPRTRAILIQHAYGLVSRDCLPIMELARDNDIKIIEDCAHAAGAMLDGEKVGNLGDISFFSSERSKVFNTITGGFSATNDGEIARRLQELHERAAEPDDRQTAAILKNVILDYFGLKHPQRWWRGDLANIRHGRHRIVSTSKGEERGRKPAKYGQRMRAPVAAIGLNQLRKIDHYNMRRVRTARRWDEWCDASGYARPVIVEGSRPIFLRYPVLVEAERKANTAWALKELGVTLGVWFVSNLHPAPIHIDGCPNANVAVARCVNLPTLVD